MRPSNVRAKDTGITHARARNDGRVTRCGIVYDRRYEPLFNANRVGVETADDVDCMTCMVKGET